MFFLVQLKKKSILYYRAKIKQYYLQLLENLIQVHLCVFSYKNMLSNGLF